ncbi:ADP-ribosylglycohydrolase family protein [Yinghuangia soli]|uniref:ADP-ribosylglycohydrolase family protein n=1 Tax=Yinghuangia soli TaxID=2908204 RepID=A0AA41PZE4_9ACTN|nr:ADP-ribosylglycohydrolase family protein [Yinghuangia soli]MCF2527262.1 ADP-ribosylglycohydrolase family protein [Yinghuangia soli]
MTSPIPTTPTDSPSDITSDSAPDSASGPTPGPTPGSASDSVAASRARDSLLALSVGDAFGAQFFVPENLPRLRNRQLPQAPWPWTDDTEMACAVYAELAVQGHIDQDRLAASFARHHDFDRGYGPTVNRMLRLIRKGRPWRELAAEPFEGTGSWGNGAAMRVAPLGAWFADDPARAAREAAASAAVTHQHPEGIAGAVAVAAATALACRPGPVDPAAFIAAVATATPPGLVRQRLHAASTLAGRTDPAQVGRTLGNGRRVSAPDTVPFTVWVAAHYPDNFEAALWATSSAGGDVDTTCAIVAGILGARVGPDGIPAAWRRAAEPLPAWSTAT